MSNNFNIFVSACKSFDPISNSAIGFYNDVTLKEKKMDLCVFTGLNYVGNEEKVKFKLDYYLKCLTDFDNSGQQGKKIPLFAISGTGDTKEKEGVNYLTYESMFAQGRTMTVPCSGLYEIQVYMMEDDINLEDSPLKRYKRYQEEEIFPISAFRFTIKKE